MRIMINPSVSAAMGLILLLGAVILSCGAAGPSVGRIDRGAHPKWVSIAAGKSHSLAVKSDGTLWAWGGNGVGQLGDGTTEGRHSPVQVGHLN